jgi:hypothetical protein
VLALIASAAASGCGRTMAWTSSTSAAGGGGDASNGNGNGAPTSPNGGRGGALTPIGIGGDAGGIAGADIGGPPLALDASSCVTRPIAACDNLPAHYYRQSFDDVPGFEQCSDFVSFDGCGKLFFLFDSQGCAVAIAPGPSGWQESEHLDRMRRCLTDTFARARFPCFASGAFGYYESCRID